MDAATTATGILERVAELLELAHATDQRTFPHDVHSSNHPLVGQHFP